MLLSCHSSLVDTLVGHTKLVFHLFIAPETGVLYSSSDDGTILRWGTSFNFFETLSLPGIALQKSFKSPTIFKGHKMGVTKFLVAPDEKQIISCSIDKSLIVWSARTVSKIMAFQHISEIKNIDADWEKNICVSGTAEGKMYLWNMEDGSSGLLGEAGSDNVEEGPEISCVKVFCKGMTV